ncbi:DUF1624 domain-containing protein [Paraglaciecola aquimarina]|uniref:DUF1624 domain-containing protein n=1 Tax=Paraglaciecola algarum TaxID=3050085 RepID=A0ABS9D2I3_9ALTE|nr:heparan-alpha-glucosaminide N-acetyltransferase [Paraglaciecola sp. G1-23]MCF2947131.1 DUF1624 domain-containing protein [Paraglaciecola sp. G1-23]
MNNPSNTQQFNRNFEVDVLRGCSIVLMIIFHFGYDLSAFGWASYNTGIDIEWRVFRVVIVSGFLLAVGMSSYLGYYQSINTKKLAKGVSKLVLVALFISVSSYFMYPTTWVYFGIIHFIAIALLLSVCFVKKPNLSLLIALVILITWYFEWITFTPLWLWSIENIGIPQRTVDLVRFYPWFSVVLIGIFLMHHKLFGFSVSKNAGTNKVAWLGKHSLSIYLIHQPILYALFTLVELALA